MVDSAMADAAVNLTEVSAFAVHTSEALPIKPLSCASRASS